jgi:hypothetical protein
MHAQSSTTQAPFSFLPSPTPVNGRSKGRRVPDSQETEMTSCLNGSLALFSTVLITGASSAILAGTGAAGAGILNASGYEGYNSMYGAQTGAVGGAILGGGTALTGLALYCCNSKSLTSLMSKTGSSSSLLSSIGWSVIGGLVGYAVLNAYDSPVMEIGHTAASFATGSAAIAGGLLCCLCCVAAGVSAVASSENN